MASTSSNRTNNATEIKTSRYVQGGTTDRYRNRLGWWERKVFSKSDTDINVTVQPNEDRRPDLVAYRVYQQQALMWLVLQYNNIVDVETEFTTGTELRLPTQRRVTLDFLTQPTGGNRIRNNV